MQKHSLSIPSRFTTFSTLFALLFVGCSGTEVSAAPALETCDYGLFDAACGGNGDPVLACDQATGACRWFAGGLVALGYEVSDCDPSNVCCHGASAMAWPYDGWTPGGAATARAQRDLEILRFVGSSVSAEYPAPSIAVSSAVIEDAPTDRRLRCSDVVGPCSGSGMVESQRVGHSLVITIHVNSGDFLIEVVDLAGVRSARIFFAQRVLDSPFDGRCLSFGGGMWAASGSLVLSASAFDDPANAHGILDVDVAGFGPTTIEF